MTGVIETICPVFGFSLSRHPLPAMPFAGRGKLKGRGVQKVRDIIKKMERKRDEAKESMEKHEGKAKKAQE